MIASMEDFFHCVPFQVNEVVAFRMLRKYHKTELPTTIIRLSDHGFFPFFSNSYYRFPVDLPPITTIRVATSLLPQIAAFVCTAFPAYILSVKTAKQDSSFVHIYYIQFVFDPQLPTPTCAFELEPIRLDDSLTNKFIVPNINYCMYFSSTIYSRLCLHNFVKRPLRMIRHSEFTDIDAAAQWKLTYYLIFLAIHRRIHPLNTRDIIQKIGSFLF